MSKAVKKKKAPASDRIQHHMKIVTSDVCSVCRTPCTRGLAYLDRMNAPGAVGEGVPCELTLPGRK